jgi:hypothetical protein
MKTCPQQADRGGTLQIRRVRIDEKKKQSPNTKKWCSYVNYEIVAIILLY